MVVTLCGTRKGLPRCGACRVLYSTEKEKLSSIIDYFYQDVPFNDSLFALNPEENNERSSNFFTLDANPVDSPTRASPHSAKLSLDHSSS